MTSAKRSCSLHYNNNNNSTNNENVHSTEYHKAHAYTSANVSTQNYAVCVCVFAFYVGWFWFVYNVYYTFCHTHVYAISQHLFAVFFSSTNKRQYHAYNIITIPCALMTNKLCLRPMHHLYTLKTANYNSNNNKISEKK